MTIAHPFSKMHATVDLLGSLNTIAARYPTVLAHGENASRLQRLNDAVGKRRIGQHVLADLFNQLLDLTR
jgi:hypothetical protein